MNKKLFNKILIFKIPIAWLAGIRLESCQETSLSVRVKLGFLNQNPFKSMFWAVQGMAAEFSSGFMAQDKISKSGKNISMLVLGMQSKFVKKAVGKIVFTCKDGEEIEKAIKQAVETGNGVTLNVTSKGIDDLGDLVSEFQFTWTFKVRS